MTSGIEHPIHTSPLTTSISVVVVVGGTVEVEVLLVLEGTVELVDVDVLVVGGIVVVVDEDVVVTGTVVVVTSSGMVVLVVVVEVEVVDVEVVDSAPVVVVLDELVVLLLVDDELLLVGVVATSAPDAGWITRITASIITITVKMASILLVVRVMFHVSFRLFRQTLLNGLSTVVQPPADVSRSMSVAVLLCGLMVVSLPSSEQRARSHVECRSGRAWR